MKLYYLFTKLQFDGHRSLIALEKVPNWFERIVLRRKAIMLHYVGHGTKWRIKHRDHTFSAFIKENKLTNFLQQLEGQQEFKRRQYSRQGVRERKFNHL